MERRVWQVVFRCLMALPLLSVVDIVPGIQDVEALVKLDSASQAQLFQLCRYVERQWITKASNGPAFSTPEVWC